MSNVFVFFRYKNEDLIDRISAYNPLLLKELINLQKNVNSSEVMEERSMVYIIAN